MSIAELRETVRFILGDHDPDQPMFTDNAVDAAVRSALTLRKVPALSLDPARTVITPEPTADQVALVCFHTAKLWLAGDPDKYEYRTRALAEKFGGSRNAMDELEQSIHELEERDDVLRLGDVRQLDRRARRSECRAALDPDGWPASEPHASLPDTDGRRMTG